MIEQGGMSWTAGRCAANASALYAWAESSDYAQPFVGDPEHRSSVTATIDFSDGVDANAVAAVLRANRVVDIESYRKLGRNQIRVGLWPSIPTSDVEALTASIDYVVGRL
jgi:phosphoserine aminotransferase